MAVILGMVLSTFIGCGKGSHISKILRKDATEASVNWLTLIKENGVNYEWDGSTLLGESIKAGRIDMVEALIKDKVDVKRPSMYYGNNGVLPLQQTLQSMKIGNDSMFDFLVNTNVSQADNEQLSSIALLLIKAGAPVKYDNFNAILYAMAHINSTLFDGLLPKYSKEMLDYSFYGNDEYQAGYPPFNNIYSDERFEAQMPLIEKLMKKGIKFGFYDIKNALEMYLSPQLYTYGNDSLFRVLAYMAKQDGINILLEEPDEISENNPIWINPLDLAIKGVYKTTSNNDIISTSPEIYLTTVKLFGDAGLRANPYNWSIKGDSSTGTLSMFMRIIAAKIDQEIIHRNPYGNWYTEAELNAKVYELWTAQSIISAFEVLSKYDALYFSINPPLRSDDDEPYPPAYLRKRMTKGGTKLPFNDLFEPYYPVFDWLANNGYLTFGKKDYLVYEDGLTVSEFFSTYDERLEEKNTIPNDFDSGINIDRLRRIASGTGGSLQSVVLEEAEEIISGKRKGISNEARIILKAYRLPFSVTTKNDDQWATSH
jgi:hypothetical protein